MNRYLPTRRALVLAAVALSLGFAPAAFPALPLIAPSIARAQVVSADPQASSPTVADLRPGFALDPSKTELREPVPGIVVYEADFTREQTPRNFRDGPIEIKSLVARTASAQQAAEQFTSSRQALVTATPPWVEGPVAKLGDEAAGLTMKGTSSEGPAVAHLYLYRRGAMVVGITVAGLEKPTTMAEAEAIAAVVLGKMDPTARTQRGQGVARPLSPRPSASPAAGAGATTGSGSSGTSTAASGATAGGTSAAGSSSATRMRVAKTDGQPVRLRAQPSLTATIAARLPEGTVVDIVGEDRQVDGLTWKNVRAPGDGRGWISAEFLVAEPGSPSSPAPSSGAASPSGAASASSGASGTSPAPVPSASPAPASGSPASGSASPGSGSASSGSRTAAPAATAADDVLTVDVTLAKTELRDGQQTLTIKVTQQGRPVEGATATVRTTRDEQPTASPTDASGTATANWSPTGEAGFVGVGVSVTAPNGATGVGSSYFNLLSSR